MRIHWKLQALVARIGPVVLFAATCCLAWWLYLDQARLGNVIGYATGAAFTIASTEPGRLERVEVLPGQPVTAGQVVAYMDASQSEREIDILEAEYERLQAQISAVEEEATHTRFMDRDHLENVVAKAELSLTRERAALERARKEEQALRKEYQRLRRLVGKRLIAQAKLDVFNIRYGTVQQEVADWPRTIRLIRQQLDEARQRLQQGSQSAGLDVMTEPLRKNMEVNRRRLAQLRAKQATLVLRAPATGRVRTIHRRGGEVVLAGEPIVALISDKQVQVIACVSEEDAMLVRVGDQATLSARGGSDVLSGRVISLGPLVDQIPLRCRTIPTHAAWGRDVVIELPEVANFLPGQMFHVRFGRHAQRPGETMAAGFEGAGDRPREIDLPHDLQQRSRFEPSGLTWQDHLSRYVVVSDDTGWPNNHAHAPWLFTMSAEGRMDPDPVLVEGISTFRDLEGIAADTKGGLYLLSSQSYSQHGKRPLSRTLFAHLKRHGMGYQVNHRLSLADLLEQATPNTLTSLGLQHRTRELNIEGLAERDGILFLGLKSPLDEAGRALIWRLGNPQALFTTGELAEADLSLWARVKLDAAVGDTKVAGGISDLLLPASNQLLLTSTPSSKSAAAETGRLWSIKLHPRDIYKTSIETLTAQAVKTFPGLRPEGLSLSPKLGYVVIAFDANQDTPYWVEIPWAQ
ncbi:MAG: HlyD family efflux transporter periplasmic adaptor subunit [Gammaproteobacteria bacterium]